MLDWTTCSAVERVPGRVSGEWVFRGTRVPVRALFENLEGGASVPEFLSWFPGVSREQVDAVLGHASRSLATSAWVALNVLFDQGTPAPLRRAFAGASVETAYERGWATLQNGALLAAADDAGFDVFVTTDKNLQYQQRVASRPCVAVTARPWRRGIHRRLGVPHGVCKRTVGSVGDRHRICRRDGWRGRERVDELPKAADWQ